MVVVVPEFFKVCFTQPAIVFMKYVYKELHKKNEVAWFTRQLCFSQMLIMQTDLIFYLLLGCPMANCGLCRGEKLTDSMSITLFFLFPEVHWESHNEVGSLSYVHPAVPTCHTNTTPSLDVMKHCFHIRGNSIVGLFSNIPQGIPWTIVSFSKLHPTRMGKRM